MALKAYHYANPSEDSEAQLKRSLAEILRQRKPACFRDTDDNTLTQMEKGYGKMLVTLQECGCVNPNELTVYEQYTWIENLEEKYEASKPK